jgi:tripartite-type tricarboxylate transporter receptor subunit TctC
MPTLFERKRNHEHQGGNVLSSFRIVARSLIAITVVCFASSALGQAYPSRPIRILVPFPPGGSGDTFARVLGQKFTESWGQPAIVESRPGGNTIIAADAVAKSPPDGYTLLLAVDATLTMNPYLYRKLPYKVESDLAPVALLAEQSLLLAVHPKSGVKSLHEFVAYAKANPGKVNLGIGSSVAQVAAELIKSAIGVDAVIVPYKGGSDTLQALAAGTIEASISDINPYLSYIRDGRLTAVAVTRARRSQSLPDVPSVSESGYSAVDVRSWFGMLAPGATPRPVVLKLNQELNRIIALPDVRERLANMGLEPLTGTTEQFAAVIKSDSAKWSKVISDAGIRLD